MIGTLKWVGNVIKPHATEPVSTAEWPALMSSIHPLGGTARPHDCFPSRLFLCKRL